jgi:putative membrane protein
MKQKKYNSVIWILTLAINGLIALSYFLPKIDFFKGYDFNILPLLNAILNGSTFMALLIALFAIKRKNVRIHKRFVLLAFCFTAAFLFFYLLYHFSVPSAKFGGVGFIRHIYFFLLITHIFLAALIVPLALITISYGFNDKIEAHRKVAYWTMPIWLYVSFTGVIIYVLISPYYLQ